MTIVGGISTSARRSFLALVCTQFLGAFNDNMFKMIVSLTVIGGVIGGHGGSAYLSTAAAVFVLPYLLFSGYAGYLSDRYGKRQVAIAAKLAEVVVMGLATVAIVSGDIRLLIGVLFLMATQSVVFSPAKYGLLPELLPVGALPSANGLLESSRYLAVILGTVVGAAALTLWRDSPLAIAALLMSVAVAGALAAVCVRHTRPGSARVRFRFDPWAEVRVGLRRLAGDPVLAWAVAGTTYFDFIGNLVMLDTLLVAKRVMGLEDLEVGLLAAAAGMGLCLGCLAAAALSRKGFAPRLVVAGILANGVFVLLLPPASGTFASMALVVALATASGGLLLVPLNALLQARPAADEKGRVIATNTFLNMAGVLASTAALWVLHDVVGLSPQSILVVVGALGLVIGLLALRRLGRAAAAERSLLEVRACASES
jgi:acyl-[acyl-carrier-protein]-phospholipid O-acyltransferase/long-chain-fatty-acid--[acyl-carrier-protein] ligase